MDVSETLPTSPAVTEDVTSGDVIFSSFFPGAFPLWSQKTAEAVWKRRVAVTVTERNGAPAAKRLTF